MSDLLIKNCEMPTFCVDCPCLDVENMACFPKERHITPPEMLKLCRPEWCPLVEVPPHGRLVDADKLLIDIMDRNIDQSQFNDYSEFCHAIHEAPTVIEASEVQ